MIFSSYGPMARLTICADVVRRTGCSLRRAAEVVDVVWARHLADEATLRGLADMADEAAAEVAEGRAEALREMGQVSQEDVVPVHPEELARLREQEAGTPREGASVAYFRPRRDVGLSQERVEYLRRVTGEDWTSKVEEMRLAMSTSQEGADAAYDRVSARYGREAAALMFAQALGLD